MGKKSKANKQTTKIDVAASAPAASAPAARSWLDDLSPEDKKLAQATSCTCIQDLEHQKRKKEANTKKAEEAQARQLRQNERNAQWEKDQQKKHREEARESKKWEQVAQQIKVRAFKEGVVECQYCEEDGYYYAKLDGGLFQQTNDQYYCSLCSKQLNDNTLQAHIESENHRKKFSWTQVDAGYPSSSPASSPSAKAPLASNVPATSWCPPVGQEWNTALEEWQMVGEDGLLRCIPCGKVIDCVHVTTEDHMSRLYRWEEQQKLSQNGYPVPEFEYLAWIPADESNPGGERWLRCLLCQKWVQGSDAHTGTREQAMAGIEGLSWSAQHRKNLYNYGPGDAWYEETVVRERLRWHPNAVNARRSPTVSSAPKSAQPAKATPAPWASPAATAPSQASTAKAATPAPWVAAPATSNVTTKAKPPAPLPPDWEYGPVPNPVQGQPEMYYYNRKTGKSSWKHPGVPEVQATPKATPTIVEGDC